MVKKKKINRKGKNFIHSENEIRDSILPKACPSHFLIKKKIIMRKYNGFCIQNKVSKEKKTKMVVFDNGNVVKNNVKCSSNIQALLLSHFHPKLLPTTQPFTSSTNHTFYDTNIHLILILFTETKVKKNI